MGRIEKGREREELVVDAAARAIAELGVSNVRVQDIAERAQMRSSHVSYYFPSKDELLLKAIRRSEQLFIDRTRESLALIEDPRDRLQELLAQASAERPGDEGWSLWLQVWAHGFANNSLSEEHRGLDQRWFDLLLEILSEGQAEGLFHVDDVTDAAETISALIDGLSVQLTVGAGRLDRARLLSLTESACQKILGT